MIIPEAIPEEGPEFFPDVIVLQGLPGSGKTTWWEEYFQSAIVLSADSFHYVDGKYCFDYTNQGAAHAWCVKEFVKALQAPKNNGKTIIVDNNNLGVYEAATYMTLPKSFNRKAMLLTFHCPIEICIRRQRHGIPIPDMMRKSRNFESGNTQFPSFWHREYIFSGGDGMEEASWVPSREIV